MDSSPVETILRQLGSEEPRNAWVQFLDEYSAVILQVVRYFEREQDHVSDCYLFICEQLCRDRFRRLRRFQINGPARFSTWLRVVLRNLCLDWHRQETGRQRVFDSVAQLSQLDQDVFRQIFERGFSEAEALLVLSPRYPALTQHQLSASVERIGRTLTPRQQWLLSLRGGRRTETETGAADTEGSPIDRLPDGGPDPELRAVQQEERERLRRAVGRMSSGDRLLLQLRYEQELTLEQVARVLHLENAQQADRRIREVLSRLRTEIE